MTRILPPIRRGTPGMTGVSSCTGARTIAGGERPTPITTATTSPAISHAAAIRRIRHAGRRSGSASAIRRSMRSRCNRSTGVRPQTGENSRSALSSMSARAASSRRLSQRSSIRPAHQPVPTTIPTATRTTAIAVAIDPIRQAIAPVAMTRGTPTAAISTKRRCRTGRTSCGIAVMPSAAARWRGSARRKTPLR